LFRHLIEEIKQSNAGADTYHVKVVVHKVELSNLHKIGKYRKEIGEKSGKLSTKSGKSELSHSQY